MNHPSGSLNEEHYVYVDHDFYNDEPTTYPEHQEWYQPSIFDINIPIHPEYIKHLTPAFEIGDLVETFAGEIGIIMGIEDPERFPALRIKGANNISYIVLINEKEKALIGYSLKKLDK
jgi:hypothetical protein